MLEEFLKTASPALTAVWQEKAPGVQVCRFEQHLPKDSVPLSFFPSSHSHYAEALFCESGTLLIYQAKDRVLSVDGRDILLLSDHPQIKSIQITSPLRGILLCVDLESQWFISCLQMMGKASEGSDRIRNKLKEHEGCTLLSESPWNRSFFSFLRPISDQEQGNYCMLKFVELLYLLSTEHLLLRNQKELQISDSYLARTVMDMRVYMESHLDEKLTIDSMSRQFYISPTAFKSCFRKIYGIPVHHWLQNRRVQKAANLLQTTSMDIILIAQSVGYEGLSQFNVVFKRQFGMTPRQYRKLSDPVNL